MELEAENWRLCSAFLVRGAICGAGSGELATLLYNFSTRSNQWSWKLRAGDFVVDVLEYAE